MTRITIASLVASHNVLASSLNVKLLRDKTSLNRATIQARIDDMQAQIDASTDTVSLVSLCIAHNKNAKSIRNRFRVMYADKAVAATLPAPLGKGWDYRAADVATILPHVTR